MEGCDGRFARRGHSTLIAPLRLFGTLVGSLFKLGHRLELGGPRLRHQLNIAPRRAPSIAQKLRRRSSFFFKVPSFDCIVA
jgi:hypothetical protein